MIILCCIRWEKLHDTFNNVSIVHEVPGFHLYYEPFFVEYFTSPLYNESFVGYGFTRSSHVSAKCWEQESRRISFDIDSFKTLFFVSQAYEMYLKNGNFKVLSPIFTAQLGLQKVKQWSAERQQQNEFNRRLFEQHVKNLNTQFHPNKVVEFEK